MQELLDLFQRNFVAEGWDSPFLKKFPWGFPRGRSGLELTDTLSLLSIDYLY